MREKGDEGLVVLQVTKEVIEGEDLCDDIHEDGEVEEDCKKGGQETQVGFGCVVGLKGKIADASKEACLGMVEPCHGIEKEADANDVEKEEEGEGDACGECFSSMGMMVVAMSREMMQRMRRRIHMKMESLK